MAKNAQVRWDDVTVMLAVIDHGSVAAAARALKINHATILRRIAEFERRTGVHMFDKTTRGYQISPDRRNVIEAMREATEALGAVERMIDTARPNLSGGLRITTTDTLAQFVLPPLLPDLIEATGAAVEVMVDNAHVDLARMHAHLTVRPAVALPPDLEGRAAGAFRFNVYGAKDCKTKAWIGLSGPLSRTKAAGWVRNRDAAPVVFGDSFLALAAMAATGLGRTILPSYVGAAWPTLTCLEQPDTLAPVPVWVGAHVDFARTVRNKRAATHLADALAATPALSQDT